MSALTSDLEATNGQKDNVTEKLLMNLAGKFGNDWQCIAIGHLGFTKNDVEQFISAGQTPIMQVFNMLHKWKCLQRPATIATLIHILDAAEMHPDALEYLKNENNRFNDLLCKCCQRYDCSCNCLNFQEILVSNSESGGVFHTIKMKIMKTHVISLELSNTLNEKFFNNDPKLYLSITNIIHRMQSKLLEIYPGCIELKLQLRSYEALMNVTQLDKRETSKGITQLAPLHQKLRDALMEELPHENIMPAMFSFQNIFEGGSYRSALEFFCAGFSLDDMLPIIKKQKSQNIDYLCIDVKGAPQTTLTDLKKEFIKKRDRKLRAIRKKLKNKLGTNDSKFMNRFIDNVLNRPGKNHGKSDKSTRETGKKRKKIQHHTLRKPKDFCMFEIPGRKMQQPQSFLEVKRPSDSQAEKLEASYKPPLKQMKILNYIEPKKVSEKIQSTVSTVQSTDAAQPKSKEENVKTKRKQKCTAEPTGDVVGPISETSMKVGAHLITPMTCLPSLSQHRRSIVTPGKKVKKVTAETKLSKKKQISTQVSESLQMKPLSEQSVQKKRNRKRQKICDQDATVSTPIKKEATYLHKETDSKKHAGKKIRDHDATVPTPIKLKPTYSHKETDSKKHCGKQAKTFEVVIFSELKRKPWICYGCKKPLRDGTNLDLILKTQDFRDYFGQCRQKHRAFKSSNVYLHLLEKCVQKKYGLFDQQKYIMPENMRARLNSAQSTMLQNMNIIQDSGATKYKSKTEKRHIKSAKTEQYKTEGGETSPSSHFSLPTLSH